jgi:hypothetical protein
LIEKAKHPSRTSSVASLAPDQRKLVDRKNSTYHDNLWKPNDTPAEHSGGRKPLRQIIAEVERKIETLQTSAVEYETFRYKIGIILLIDMVAQYIEAERRKRRGGYLDAIRLNQEGLNEKYHPNQRLNNIIEKVIFNSIILSRRIKMNVEDNKY